MTGFTRKDFFLVPINGAFHLSLMVE